MQILIIHAHSAHNLGDEAIMIECLRGLHQIFPAAIITISANDPASWAKFKDYAIIGSFAAATADTVSGYWKWNKLRLVSLLLRTSLFSLIRRDWLLSRGPIESEMLRAMHRADLILSIGGGNIFATRIFSPGLHCALASVAAAVALDKPVVFLPQSIGPVAGSAQKFILKSLLNRAKCVMLREDYSARFLRKLGVCSSAAVFSDLALSSCVKQASERVHEAQLPETGLRLGLTALPFDTCGSAVQQKYENTLIEAMDRITRQFAVRWSLFSQSTGPTLEQNDTPCAQRLEHAAKELKITVNLEKPADTAQDLAEEYGRLTGLVTSRTHSAIFALSQGVPAILIGKRPKARGIIEQFEMQDYYCELETLSVDVLCRKIEQLLEQRETLRPRLQRRAAELSKLTPWTENLVRQL